MNPAMLFHSFLELRADRIGSVQSSRKLWENMGGFDDLSTDLRQRGPEWRKGAESSICGAIFSQIGILITLLLHGWIVVDLALWHGPAMSRVRADHPVVDACYSLRFHNESWSVLLESLNLAPVLLSLVCVIFIIIGLRDC